MADRTLVDDTAEWLVEQALDSPDIVQLFQGVCDRLSAIDVPIARARLMWMTLHPLVQAESILWRRGQATEFVQLVHEEARSDAWLQSPMHFMLEGGIPVFRRRLEGDRRLLDFEMTRELAEEGYTDYLVIGTPLFPAGMFRDDRRNGMFVTWASDRPGGFTDADIASLQRIQRRFAVTCKVVIQARIGRNITDTYLGSQAGRRVLEGSIRLGDGQETRAIVWFSDMRDSTRLADALPSSDYLELLNCYFECVARPAIREGGEILGFIGDAVLAIFPVGDEASLGEVSIKVMRALEQALAEADRLNVARAERGVTPIRFGIGLNVGAVMFGNIGVPERLAFSAIGPTVNEVARIEKLTKTTGARVLATRDVARSSPARWRSLGPHAIEGLTEPMELFALLEDAARTARP